MMKNNDITKSVFHDEPLGIDPGLPAYERGDQAPFSMEKMAARLVPDDPTATYKAGRNLFWMDIYRAMAQGAPYNEGQVERLKTHFFKDARVGLNAFVPRIHQRGGMGRGGQREGG
eukprot:255829-Pyramimonas_sp.AAC.1